MCHPAQKVQELEDLFKDDELNNLTNVNDENILEYIKNLAVLVSNHIKTNKGLLEHLIPWVLVGPLIAPLKPISPGS